MNLANLSLQYSQLEIVQPRNEMSSIQNKAFHSNSFRPVESVCKPIAGERKLERHGMLAPLAAIQHTSISAGRNIRRNDTLEPLPRQKDIKSKKKKSKKSKVDKIEKDEVKPKTKLV